MLRIIKALILAWIGKKIYDRTLGHDASPDDETEAKPAARTAAHKKAASPAKKSSAKRSTRKPASRAA